jgi:hypothetical protein
LVRVEHVPLNVHEAMVLHPRLREWIISKTEKQLETFEDNFYATDVERLRAKLSTLREAEKRSSGAQKANERIETLPRV